jgi:replicative DNA helicase
VLHLDEKTLTTEGVITMRDMAIFQAEEEHIRKTIFLGINNTLDAAQISTRESLILFGGKRGAGKSIAVNNILVNQYEQGNSCLYFSIEMPGYEILQRTISILANVNHQQLKQNKLSADDILKVVRCRAGMFEDSQDLVKEFLETNDRFKFEERLQREKQLKQDNQMVIIDDRALSLSAVDLHIGKFKAKFGDKLTTVVVDYLNQIVFDGNHNKFDWQPQIEVATKLKELARKYDVVMVSPYQIDDTGVARFSKGILDAADAALLMEVHDKDLQAMTFESTKMRGNRELKCTSPINWDTLRISPQSIDSPPPKERASTKKTKAKAEGTEDVTDIPWKV